MVMVLMLVVAVGYASSQQDSTCAETLAIPEDWDFPDPDPTALQKYIVDTHGPRNGKGDPTWMPNSPATTKAVAVVDGFAGSNWGSIVGLGIGDERMAVCGLL